MPLREEIVERTQEQVNFMLMGVFELLRAKRQEYDAYLGYLEAVRDYWLARAALGQAVGRTLPDAGAGTHRVGADQLTTPESTDMDDLQQGDRAPSRSDEPSAHTGHGDET
jgi:cobalt-zinc-cadmium efflux system outer membrane protein